MTIQYLSDILTKNDENVSKVIDFRPDGSEVRVMTFPDGYSCHNYMERG